MPKHKNQHFNARSYLRRFAAEDGHLQTINVHTGNVEDCRSPRSVGQESYFYGREERAVREHAFKHVEDAADSWMNEIQRTEELPPRGSPEHLAIAMWTTIQHGRTRKGRNAANKAMRMLGVNTADVDGAALLSSVWSASDFPHMYDLSYMLLKIIAGKDLWIGDNPVIRMNPWLEGKGIDNGFGTAWWDRGLCVVVPITKRLAIIWYDGIVYESSTLNEKRIECQDVDADWLNARQIRNSSVECYSSNGTHVEPMKISKWRVEAAPMPTEMLKLSEKWCDYEEKCKRASVDIVEFQETAFKNIRQAKLFVLAEEFKRRVAEGNVDVGDWGQWFESNWKRAI